MPHEPHCASGRMGATKGDDAVRGSETARPLWEPDSSPRRNPGGRAALAAGRCRSGLAHWSPMRRALASWPAAESAPSRPRGIPLGPLSFWLPPTATPPAKATRPKLPRTSRARTSARCTLVVPHAGKGPMDRLFLMPSPRPQRPSGSDGNCHGRQPPASSGNPSKA